MRTRRTLDEAIAHSLDVARHGTEVEDVCEHAQLARWLAELKERRTLGYHPPCPSCRWKDNCVVTAAGRVTDSWNCTMYEAR